MWPHPGSWWLHTKQPLSPDWSLPSLFCHLLVINWFFVHMKTFFVSVGASFLWHVSINLCKRAGLFSWNAINCVSVPLYLVEVQIDPLKADASLVAHGDQHRIWILKLRTLGSLRRLQNKSDTVTFDDLHFKYANHLTDTLICRDR